MPHESSAGAETTPSAILRLRSDYGIHGATDGDIRLLAEMTKRSLPNAYQAFLREFGGEGSLRLGGMDVSVSAALLGYSVSDRDDALLPIGEHVGRLNPLHPFLNIETGEVLRGDFCATPQAMVVAHRSLSHMAKSLGFLQCIVASYAHRSELLMPLTSEAGSSGAELSAARRRSFEKLSEVCRAMELLPALPSEDGLLTLESTGEERPHLALHAEMRPETEILMLSLGATNQRRLRLAEAQLQMALGACEPEPPMAFEDC